MAFGGRQSVSKGRLSQIMNRLALRNDLILMNYNRILALEAAWIRGTFGVADIKTRLHQWSLFSRYYLLWNDRNWNSSITLM